MPARINSTAVLMLAASAILLWQLWPANNRAVQLSDNHNSMNAFIRNARYTDYNEQGQMHSRLKASEVRHFAHEDTSIISEPKGVVMANDGSPWQIAARHGRSQRGNEAIYLWGHVKLHQPKASERPDTTIQSTSMWYYPKQSLATTKANATLDRGGSHMRGRGVNANLNTGVVQVLSNSSGSWSPSDEKASH